MKWFKHRWLNCRIFLRTAKKRTRIYHRVTINSWSNWGTQLRNTKKNWLNLSSLKSTYRARLSQQCRSWWRPKFRLWLSNSVKAVCWTRGSHKRKRRTHFGIDSLHIHLKVFQAKVVVLPRSPRATQVLNHSPQAIQAIKAARATRANHPKSTR